MRISKFHSYHFACIGCFFLLCCLSFYGHAQSRSKNNQVTIQAPFKTPVPFLPGQTGTNLFGSGNVYIENIGQYEASPSSYSHLGSVRYSYEGLGWPVLFTTKGLIYRQRKAEQRSLEEMEEAERKGILDEKEEHAIEYTDRTITLEWINANPAPVIVAEEPTTHYYTYGKIPAKAYGFKKLIYKDLYPGIDLVYTFIKQDRPGFEYSLVVRPGADLSKVQLRMSGDITRLYLDKTGSLNIGSDIDTITQTAPVSYYTGSTHTVGSVAQPDKSEQVPSAFAVKGNDVQFFFPVNYDTSRTLVIDPFVTAASNLTGQNTGIAKDIDFDYEGNIYVTGGGSFTIHQLAKYDKDGNLLWTFAGTLSNPVWSFGSNYGGWVVEKSTGKIYLGQGGVTFRVVRLKTDGTYDDYISTRNDVFQENWKMFWNCDGGVPKIMIAGGGSANENINLGIFSPPSTTLSPLNITGQPSGHQDMADMVIDPRTNEMYCIFSQGFIPTITENNRLYKHKPPYNASNMVWNRLSGYTVLSERNNRPYLGQGLNDNSINSLAVNASYLFYYDGQNLAALNKANGSNVGADQIVFSNSALAQGGIVADECNNVFVGSSNGTIKVYKFTGSGFDDGAVPDISIAGFSNAAVYDLAYDNAKRLLYASGRGFVGAFDITSYCTARIYSMALKRDCVSGSVEASLTPSLQSGSTLTYVLYAGTTELASNSTGVFTGLDKTTVYTIKALVDRACGGPQVVRNFDLVDCTIADDPEDDGPNGPTDPVKTGIYVPTAFTPDGDGLNDQLKITARGIKELKYFSLYNRWGEQVFTTQDPLKGWNGIYKGQKQASGTFVWMVEAIGSDGTVLKQKGTTQLIR